MSEIQNKYHLKCKQCGYITPNLQTWFEQGQQCPKCHSKRSEAWYESDYQQLLELIKTPAKSLWHYFPFLPLMNEKNIVSQGEGAVPIERWTFLEEFAKKQYGLNINVHACRNDLNGGTGTFKDLSGTMAASVFSELGFKQYCIASTGNSATTYSKYLSLANISCSVFMPEDTIKASEATISACGQQVFRVMGDYAKAKEVADAYSKKYNIPKSIGNIDPVRVEAKKTMVFEWLRQMDKFPDVYIQSVSGGTGPIAVDKGVREAKAVFPELQNPRLLLVQSNGCDPMVQAWEKAKAEGFPEGFEKIYPIIENPKTDVPTLATGHPYNYPILAKLVKNSGGDFVRMQESKLVPVGKLVAYEQGVLLGPASIVCVAGFFNALETGLINDGETVLLNTGEGINRAPEFLQQMIYTTHDVHHVEECKPHSIEDFRAKLWEDVLTGRIVVH